MKFEKEYVTIEEVYVAYYDSFNIRRKVWAMMPHKDRVFCVNMKKIRIKYNYKN